MSKQRNKILGKAVMIVVVVITGLGCYWQYWEWQHERIWQLANAASLGETRKVKSFLDAGVPPDAKNFHSRSALESAAYGGYTETVRLLLDRGADPNGGLRWAVAGGHTELLIMLLAKGAKVQGKAGASALGQAVRRRNLAAVNLLLKNGADINAIDDYHETALQHAASGDSWEMFQALLQQGASVDVRSSGGETMLMIAARGDSANSKRICDYLIRHGADVNARDDKGLSALIWSVRLQRDSKPHRDGMLAILDTLLRSGADVNARDKQGRTALRYAAEFRNVEAKKLLTKWGGVL